MIHAASKIPRFVTEPCNIISEQIVRDWQRAAMSIESLTGIYEHTVPRHRADRYEKSVSAVWHIDVTPFDGENGIDSAILLKLRLRKAGQHPKEYYYLRCDCRGVGPSTQCYLA